MTRAESLIEMLMEAGGQEAGVLEIASMTLKQATDYMEKRKFDWQKEIPDFVKNFKAAQKKAKAGWTVRREMPVIEDRDVRQLQQRLKNGKIDIEKPFAKTTNPKNPFPQGLQGFDAKDFVERGLKDGSKTDDQVKVRNVRARVGDLIPIQKQIYFEKSIGKTVENGMKASLDFIKNGFLIISADKYIIDGHHRFLQGVIIDPDMKVGALEIDLPIKKLLPMSVAYSDAIGNKRNE
jgi:hypothetical protein